MDMTDCDYDTYSSDKHIFMLEIMLLKSASNPLLIAKWIKLFPSTVSLPLKSGSECKISMTNQYLYGCFKYYYLEHT